jgi:histidine triad (HIT) family protein
MHQISTKLILHITKKVNQITAPYQNIKDVIIWYKSSICLYPRYLIYKNKFYKLFYMKTCIFCEIINGKLNSRKIYETKYSIAFLDAFPLKEGHTLIISKTHKTKIQELNNEENNDIFSTLRFLINHIENTVKSNSTLIAIHNGEEAGQEIPHVHIHIIPIKKSDKPTTIHSMFTKEKFSENKLDEIWNKMKYSLQHQN